MKLYKQEIISNSQKSTCSGIKCGELVQAPAAAVHAALGRVEGGGPHVVRVLGDPGAGPPVVRAAGLAGLAQAHLPHVGEPEHLGGGPIRMITNITNNI